MIKLIESNDSDGFNPSIWIAYRSVCLQIMLLDLPPIPANLAQESTDYGQSNRALDACKKFKKAT